MNMVGRVVPICLRLLARVYLKFDLPVNATKHLEQAINLAPQDKELYFLLADAYQRSGKLTKMLSVLETATKLFPEEVDFFWALGVRLLYLGDAADALLNLKYYLENFSGDKFKLANINAILGTCYMALMRWDDAEAHLKKSRELVPWDLDAFVGFVELYSSTRRSDLVLGFIDDYINQFPSLYPLYLWKGHYLRYNLRQPQKSLEFYQQGLQRVGSREARDFCDGYLYTKNLFDRLLNEYVDALIACGRSNEVLVEIQKYERLKVGSSIESKKRLIDFYVETKNHHTARKIINEIPGWMAHTPEMLTSLATIELDAGELEKSLNVIRAALEVDNTSDEALDVLGEIQMKAGRWMDAVETYSALLKRHPLEADLYASLGLCYFEMKQYAKARECYEICTTYDELNADAWIDLGDICVKFGDNEFAVSAYKNGLKYDWLNAEKRQQALQAIEQLTTG